MSARRPLTDRTAGPRRLLGARPRLRDADEGPLVPAQAPRTGVPARLPPIPPPVPGAVPPAVPDLLNVVPALTVDPTRLVRTLTFSFVAGHDAGGLSHVFDDAPLAESTFEPTCFFEELFVEEMVRGCLRPQLNGKEARQPTRYLMRVLSQPPAAPEVRAQRTAVLAELVDDAELRLAFTALAVRLQALWALFAGDDQVSLRGEQTRRRIDILRAIAETVGALHAEAFRKAGSVLHRLPLHGDVVRQTPAFQRLEELLRYENERAYADLTLQIGADGRVRGLRVVAVREDTRNRYHVSIWRQWFDRLRLFGRGFRVDDAEIVDRWLDQVFDDIAPALPPLIQLAGDVAFYLAALSFRDTCLARGLPVCFPTWVGPEEPAGAEAVFNPLLMALGVQPVPGDVTLPPWGETTLITGPNSGGKTRLLQAVGLMQLCAQAGLFVPARSARLRSVPGLFASLSQPAGAEQSEGRLGTELMRIRMLFERSAPGTLVLVDELCSGTSPSEGEELFKLVLELLRELSPVAFISTHFLHFAADLAAEPDSGPGGALPLHFIQVVLDERQRPTYRFTAGVAETSLAQQTAARLGVTREELRAVLAAKRPPG